MSEADEDFGDLPFKAAKNGSLNTENVAAVIISSNKFRIGKAAYKINMRSFRYVRQ